MTTQEASVIISGMALIGLVCWLTHSMAPLYGVLFLLGMLII